MFTIIMVGYPIYDKVPNTKQLYFSDMVVCNSVAFWYGFIFAVVTSPSLAFAQDNGITPTQSPGQANQGNVPTATRDKVQGVAAVAGCSAAAAQCSKVVDQAYQAATAKMSNVNPPTLIAVVGCAALLGYCAGKLTTEGIDKALGFK